jgi:hypothetical protein
MKVIYTLTALNLEKHPTSLAPKDCRCWGWFPTFEEALECLKADNNDLIFESATYTHAVIEAVPPGFMGLIDAMDNVDGPDGVWWFQAHPHSDHQYHIEALNEAPADWKGVIGFAMG